MSASSIVNAFDAAVRVVRTRPATGSFNATAAASATQLQPPAGAVVSLVGNVLTGGYDVSTVVVDGGGVALVGNLGLGTFKEMQGGVPAARQLPVRCRQGRHA
jgi:hypothetical protein